MSPTTQRTLLLALGLTLSALRSDQASGAAGGEEPDAPLPAGVKVAWDLGKAYRENTPTRERVCLNGLWRWQPAQDSTLSVPADKWGFFKVPGFWPGTNNYIQEDCQTLYHHPSWQGFSPQNITAAWYQREMTVPVGWTGRNIILQAECLNSFAVVYVDGKKAGEMRYPLGKVDVTAACRPGGQH